VGRKIACKAGRPCRIWRASFDGVIDEVFEDRSGADVNKHTGPKEKAMGTIKVHEFTTLDGVIDAPTWTFDYPFDPKMGDAIANMMGDCKSILLGRRTFEMFAPAWSQRTAADDPGAPFMNDSRKYVVASTSPSVDWSNSTVIGPYDAAAIRRLKDE